MATIFDALERNAAWYPDEEAIVGAERRLTWSHLLEEVIRASIYLGDRGVSRGTRIATLSENSVDFAVLYFAAASIGAVLSPLNYWSRLEEILYVISDLDCDILLYSERFLDTAKSVSHGVDGLSILRMGPSEWDTYGSQQFQSVSLEENDDQLVLYTSGTGGKPKGVVLSQGRSYHDAIKASLAFGWKPSDCYVAYTPMFHLTALYNLNVAALVASKYVVLEKFEPVKAIRAINDECATILFGFHTTLRALGEAANLEDGDLSTIRLLIYAAYDPSLTVAPLILDARNAGHEWEVVHTYGSTEVGHASLLGPTKDLSILNSVGKPYPGVNISIVDESGASTERGAVGEILIRTDTAMSRYLNRPIETLEAVSGQGILTGDLGFIDETNNLHVVGRKKDVIRTGGENVSAREVEEAISNYSGVAEVAVISVPDEVWEESVCAVLVASEGFNVDGLDSFLREQLAGFKVPKKYLIWSSLPKTPVGKVAKDQVRVRVLEELSVAEGTSGQA